MPLWLGALIVAGALALVLGLLLGLPPQARRPITVIEGHWLPQQNRPREAAAYLAERPLVEGRYPAFRVVGLTDAYWPLGKMKMTREA